MSETETIDKLFLELSQFTSATTKKELDKDAVIERLREERIDKLLNAPCADALDFMWKKLFDESYGDWEYPGQAARHVVAVVNELGVNLKERDERIEELEKERDDACKAIVLKIKSLKGHHITTAQIDAVIELADNKWWLEPLWIMLKIFGIVRCGGCGGSNQVEGHTECFGMKTYGPCPDCNGKGWKREEKNAEG